MVYYRKPELGSRAKAALDGLADACRQDGLELREANLLVHDGSIGDFRSLSFFRGEWRELVGGKEER